MTNQQGPTFKIFIGVDQTGASLRGGQAAKPLPCAVVFQQDESWKLKVFSDHGAPLRLASFDRQSIEALTSSLGFSLSETALAVDCVMGLADETWPSCGGGSGPLWNLFTQAARDTAERSGYGLKPAALFFDSLREKENLKTRPSRRCEIVSGANSVFNTHPFQKNVQCGTYRIWRDLGAEQLPPHRRWLRFWNFDPVLISDPATEQAWFFESYPSLFWRTLLGARTRNITQLRERVQSVFQSKIQIDENVWSLLERDADHADSAVLALGAWLLQNNGELFKSSPVSAKMWLKREGWILGLPFSPPPDTRG